MATAPDLTRPLLLDRSAFEASDDAPKLRTDLRVPFGDGIYRFRLGPHEVSMIEGRFRIPDRSGLFRNPGEEPLGLGTVYSRLCKGRALFKSGAPIMAGIGVSDPAEAMFFRSDIELVIGWGLIGGGDIKTAGDQFGSPDYRGVMKLLKEHVKDKPLAPLWTLAFAIVGTHLFGREPDPETGD